MKKIIVFIIIIFISFSIYSEKNNRVTIKFTYPKEHELSNIKRIGKQSWSYTSSITSNLKKSPDIAFNDPVTGKSYTIKKLRGKLVILGVFDADYKFNWEFKLLDRIQKMFPDKTFVILGIVNGTTDYIKSLKNKYNPDFPVVDITEFYQNIDFGNTAKWINLNYIITEDGDIIDEFKEDFSSVPYSYRQYIEYRYIKPFFKNSNNLKPRKIPYSITEVCERNDIDLLKKLLKKSIKEINDFEGKYNPLIYAVLYNNYEMLKILLDNGADINFTKKEINYQWGDYYKGYSALACAIKENDYNMTKTLIKYGADINIIKKYNEFDFYNIVNSKNTEFLNFLFNNINDKKFLSKKCYWIIYMFFKYGTGKLDDSEVIKLLISQIKSEKDINEVFFPFFEGEITLFNVLKPYEIENILKNLIDNGLDFFIQNEEGQTPYMVIKSKNFRKTTAYIEDKLKQIEKKYSNLIILAKQKLTYKEILVKGIKPKLKPDYKFPCYQQGKYDCFGFTLKHIVEYKYGETIDVASFNKKYGEDWISFNEEKFAAMNGFEMDGIYQDNQFFYRLAIGEPIIINYRYYYKSGGSIRHYAVAYSFDEHGIWIADSAGGKRWRMSYDKFYSKDGVGEYACGAIVYKK